MLGFGSAIFQFILDISPAMFVSPSPLKCKGFNVLFPFISVSNVSIMFTVYIFINMKETDFMFFLYFTVLSSQWFLWR